jgi:hypothetical protein
VQRHRWGFNFQGASISAFRNSLPAYGAPEIGGGGAGEGCDRPGGLGRWGSAQARPAVPSIQIHHPSAPRKPRPWPYGWGFFGA